MECINPYIFVGLKYNGYNTVGSYSEEVYQTTKHNRLEKLLNTVCEALDIEVVEAKGKKRDAEIVRARQIYCYLAKRMGFTFKNIGKVINRDHATVIYACKLVKNRKFDFKILADYNRVIDKI